MIRHGSTSWNTSQTAHDTSTRPPTEGRYHDMTDEYAEIDLAALSDDELTEQMHNDLYDGMAAEITEGTNILLGRGWTPTKVLDDALVAGMKIVGIDFRDGILFVPEVLLAANAMKAGMAILRPLLAGDRALRPHGGLELRAFRPRQHPRRPRKTRRPAGEPPARPSHRSHRSRPRPPPHPRHPPPRRHDLGLSLRRHRPVGQDCQ